jgi:hypothetical protein
MTISGSRIVMVLTLVALAIVVYFTMNSCETFNNIKNINNSESFTNKDTPPVRKIENFSPVKNEKVEETFVNGADNKINAAPAFIDPPPPSSVYHSYPADIIPHDFQPNEIIPNDFAPVPTNFTGGINYGEANTKFKPTNKEGFLDTMMKNTNDILSGNYAQVNLNKSSTSATTDEDVNDIYLKLEGTDFLSAPLADRMYYTNSIANVNRNASQDVRGDIPITYNTSYTPFNQSSIYGEPMTINRLGDIPVTFSATTRA